ncbi:MAG TPA: DEAD/DEAH box helicase, partial [bacterium]|nr:DEAD/DEAH box helicase [bacterium]
PIPVDVAEAPLRVGGGGEGSGVLDLKALAQYRWEVALGDETLSPEEFRALAEMQAPLVRWRGTWVAVDPKDLERSRELLARSAGTLSAGTALAALVTGETELFPGEPVEVVADGDLQGIARWLRSESAGVETAEPRGFHGELRPYQRRGLGWLAAMEQHGVGACLADDMGLGKTIQVIALALHRPAPTLLVCPTSVVGNWERELARFAPEIPVARHHGTTRAKTPEELVRGVGSNGIVVTTYALVRRDERLLAQVPWRRIVLDEAQAIKNPAARQSKAVRALVSAAGGHSLAGVSRLALTGTPVENRLAELWSILDALNPGLLGSLDSFRRRYAVPIERLADETVALKLKRLVQPFVLRRLKSDPAVASSLPEKNEMNVVCTLTREQASLYQAQVDAAMAGIAETQGMKRKGKILALITALKQICNHPSQFAKDASPLGGRSGKLTRLLEMLDEVLASNAKALVFTQFRQMGDRLVKAIGDAFGEEVLFLHGGVPALDRDEMVERFQSPDGPRIFVLSLKAGGFGLNLTAATNVFHFDRWWNPAVEDQATNRAHRIGQTKNVSVFKLLTAGTLEERIDKLLESKRGLADKVLGAGEQWLTEMSDDDLRLLVSLGPDAEVADEPDAEAIEEAAG